MHDAQTRKTLHVVPGDSAAGSLRHALAAIGRDDRVLAFRDDLSCGPIDPDDPALREAWWGFEEDGVIRDSLISFWAAVESTSDRLVLWYSRHSARELTFFLFWVFRLGDRPYDVIDVTGHRLSYRKFDGQPAVTTPLIAVGITPTDALPALFGKELALTAKERHTAGEDWRRLKSENAHFRVVTTAGLVSASEDHFDVGLLDCATGEWQKMARVVGVCLSRNWEPFIQVGDIMLRDRVIALVQQGCLVADGDVNEMQACRVRLPG